MCIWGMQHSWVIKSLNCGPFRAFKGGGGGGGGYLDPFSPAQKGIPALSKAL